MMKTSDKLKTRKTFQKTFQKRFKLVNEELNDREGQDYGDEMVKTMTKTLKRNFDEELKQRHGTKRKREESPMMASTMSVASVETTTDDLSSNSKVSNGPSLPEGFFDDPKLDAKVRGLEYRNSEEIEWENFVKEIASEEVKSSTMRVVDEEESTVTRELDEIEEQMTHWQRVLDLERKSEELKKQKSKIQKSMEVEEDDDDDIDEIYEEDLDWRSKRH